jgi:phosphoribosylformylglycinamidine synthase
MAHRVVVALKPGVADVVGGRVAAHIQQHLNINVEDVQIIDVFTVVCSGEVTAPELERAGQNVLCDPVIQQARLDRPLAQRCRWVLEVGYRPGVTDNVGRTASEGLQLCLGQAAGPNVKVHHSKQYLLHGNVSRDEVEQIAGEYLANELIQQWRVADGEEFKGFEPYVPTVSGGHQATVDEVDLDLNDDALSQLSDDRLLALSLDELRAIRTYFTQPEYQKRREAVGLGARPTDVELECLAQSWSEHCKHKIFNAEIDYREGDAPPRRLSSLFDTYIKGTTKKVREQQGAHDRCVTVFEDNAGVVAFDDDWLVTFKVETHNSPSALDPYGGSLTGIVGVNRDPMGTGLGAELVFNTDIFCLASPQWQGELPPRLLHPRRVLEGVREGVEHGGNKSGIPTVNGSLVFDERYLGKPLVYCGTGGIMPRTVNGRPGEEKKILAGDRVVMVGGRVGKDGIHGATFSSQELDENSPASAVQIGDPITQKRMHDLLLRLRDAGLYRAITDNGAGGLSSSVGETALLSGGADIDLALVPLKYGGLAPWEILVSESQERMTIAVPPENLNTVMDLAQRMGVEATDIGEYTSDGAFIVRHGDSVVAFLDLDFIHRGAPTMELEARWPATPPTSMHVASAEPVGALLRRVLARPNVCSKEYWVRQYDHEVQAGSVVKPLTGKNNDGPSDAAVTRPRLDSQRALAVSHGICPRYSDLDAYHMAQCALDEAVRSAVAVGGSPDEIWALDNFCWPDPVRSEKNPEGAYKLAQLVRTCQGLHDLCVTYAVPLISGKDSMKNDYRGGGVTISIPPTLLVSAVSIVPEASRAVTMDAKRSKDRVYVVGRTYADLGQSELAQELELRGGQVPQVRDAEGVRESYRRLHQAIQQGLVASCHDCSDGGLAVSLAETAFAGDLGMRIDLAAVPRGDEMNDLEVLFSESPCRLVVTVAPHQAPAFEQLMAGAAQLVGEVVAEQRLTVQKSNDELVMDEPLGALREAWQSPMRW